MQDRENEDLRIFQRFPVKLPLRFLDLENNREGVAETIDVSAKGIGFTTSEYVGPNSTVEMWLKVPDKGDPVYTRGEVVWAEAADAQKVRCGVNLDRADLMGISRILLVI